MEETLQVQGTISVDLFVSSDQKDTDVCLRLTEVYPDGQSILLGESIRRMRFRNGYEVADTSFMENGEIYPVHLEFEALANTFQEGNRIRLIVTSSNYPRYNRNMNTGAEMYPNTNIDTLVNPLIATNTLHLGSDFPSTISFPVGSPMVSANEIPFFNKLQLFPNPRKH